MSVIEFKTSIIRSNFCDYSDAYIHVKGKITVPNNVTAAAPNNRKKNVISNNRAPFTNCIFEINSTQVDDAHGIYLVMSMHNLIEYSITYSKTSGSLWQCYRDKPVLNDNDVITDFLADSNNSISFKFKQQITGQIGNNGIKDVETKVPLKHLCNFSRTL